MTTKALFEKLKHPNPHLQERAMLELAEVRDEKTIPTLMEILGAEDIPYRRTAVKTLGVIGLDAVPFLVESLLNNENPNIRGSCAKALAQVAVNHSDKTFPVEGIQALKTALADDDPVVHISSAMALGAVGAPALDTLIEVLNTTDNLALKLPLINAVSSIADSKSTEVLTKLSTDENVDSYVRESAISALSRLEMISNFKNK